MGHGSLADAPGVNHATLAEKGFGDEQIAAVEEGLGTAFDIRFAFNKWTLGDAFCTETLGLDAAALDDMSFDMLGALGFTEEQIAAANNHACGTMTLEGAPQPEGRNTCRSSIAPTRAARSASGSCRSRATSA